MESSTFNASYKGCIQWHDRFLRDVRGGTCQRAICLLCRTMRSVSSYRSADTVSQSAQFFSVGWPVLPTHFSSLRDVIPAAPISSRRVFWRVCQRTRKESDGKHFRIRKLLQSRNCVTPAQTCACHSSASTRVWGRRVIRFGLLLVTQTRTSYPKRQSCLTRRLVSQCGVLRITWCALECMGYCRKATLTSCSCVEENRKYYFLANISHWIIFGLFYCLLVYEGVFWKILLTKWPKR